jgi:phage terminase large subunit
MIDDGKLRVKTARVFVPLTKPARYKGAWGGRGSGKSHFFAEMLVEECLLKPGTRAVCIREKQKSLKDSSKHLIEKKINDLGLGDRFEVTNLEIRAPGGGLIMFTGMQDHTAESIKSLEGCRIAWVDEAQSLSARSLSYLRPTIRYPNSELWFSWNPRYKGDPVDAFLRNNPPHCPEDPTKHAIVVKANWSANPWWNPTMDAERQIEHDKHPDRYGHVWDGEYAQAFEGAYFAKVLLEAREGKRIGAGPVSADPHLPLRMYFDLGGAGAEADAFVIWVVQFVNQEIRVLDYYERQGQDLGSHLDWIRRKKYDRAVCFLPHDGMNVNNITAKRYEDHMRDAGLDVTSIPNQGRGAAAARIEAVRKLMHKCWFNNTPDIEDGVRMLGFYHEKRHPERNVGLGPEHDFSSHAADAFGLMAICYEEPGRAGNFNRALSYPRVGVA